jgi:hypothetical protein
VVAVTLQLLPKKLASLEPVKAALKTAFEADLPAALTYVQGLYPSPAITLDPPKLVRIATVSAYEEVTQWPTVTIETGALGPRMNDQQVATGALNGLVRVICWLQASNKADLDYLLDRWGAAVVLLLKQYDSLGGAEIAPEQPRIDPDPAGGSLTRRYVQIEFDVVLWV